MLKLWPLQSLKSAFWKFVISKQAASTLGRLEGGFYRCSFFNNKFLWISPRARQNRSGPWSILSNFSWKKNPPRRTHFYIWSHYINVLWWEDKIWLDFTFGQACDTFDKGLSEWMSHTRSIVMRCNSQIVRENNTISQLDLKIDNNMMNNDDEWYGLSKSNVTDCMVTLD